MKFLDSEEVDVFSGQVKCVSRVSRVRLSDGNDIRIFRLERNIPPAVSYEREI